MLAYKLVFWNYWDLEVVAESFTGTVSMLKFAVFDVATQLQSWIDSDGKDNAILQESIKLL